MSSLLLVLVIRVAGLGLQLPNFDVVVPASAARESIQIVGELVRELEAKPKPGYASNDRTGPEAKSLLEFLRPHEPLRIVVDRYSPALWKESTLKAQLQAVLTARMEGMFSQTLWQEQNSWSFAAAILFKDGSQGKIFLDGSHGCYEDPEGFRWFFRYTNKVK